MSRVATGMMKKKIDKLSESDIEALLHYFAGQH